MIYIHESAPDPNPVIAAKPFDLQARRANYTLSVRPPTRTFRTFRTPTHTPHLTYRLTNTSPLLRARALILCPSLRPRFS